MATEPSPFNWSKVKFKDMSNLDKWCADEKVRRHNLKESQRMARQAAKEFRASKPAIRKPKKEVAEALIAIKAKELEVLYKIYELQRLKAVKTRFKNTDIEVKTQEMLSALNIKFETDVRLLPGRFRGVDIYVPSRKLAIECDGEYWHSKPRAIENDLRKTEMLKDAGYKVLRLWGTEIHKMTPEDLWCMMQEITFSKNT